MTFPVYRSINMPIIRATRSRAVVFALLLHVPSHLNKSARCANLCQDSDADKSQAKDEEPQRTLRHLSGPALGLFNRYLLLRLGGHQWSQTQLKIDSTNSHISNSSIRLHSGLVRPRTQLQPSRAHEEPRHRIVGLPTRDRAERYFQYDCSLRRREADCQEDGTQGLEQNPCRRRSQALRRLPQSTTMDIYRPTRRGCTGE